MADVPSPLTYGTVVGKFTSILVDDADPGEAPNLVPLEGTVSITPSISRVYIPGAVPQMAFTTPVTAVLVDGMILGPDKLTPLRMLATDSPGINPTDFEYKATFSFAGAASPEPVVFKLPGGTTKDLTPLISAQSVPASQLVPSEAVAIRAEQAAARAEAAAAGGGGGGGGNGTVTAAGITDATTIGRNVIKAADGSVIRGLIGAGTSSLAIGTTAGTAAAGNDSRLSDARVPLTHTSSLISDFTEAAQDAVAALLQGTSGVTLSYNDAANTLTITGPGAGTGGGVTAEDVRDLIGVALIGTAPLQVAVNDAADTITLTITGLTASSITDFMEAVQDVIGALLSAATGTGITLTYNDASNTFTVAGPLVGGVLPLAALPSHTHTLSQITDFASHTVTSAQVTDFTEAAQDAIAALLQGTSGVTLSYNDASNTLTIAGGGSGTTDPEVVRDTIGAALLGTGVITVSVNDAADTITISSAATTNSTDAALRDRSTHTGTQGVATITASELIEFIQDTVAAYVVAGANVTKTYDDAANTLTIGATGGGSSSSDFRTVYHGSTASTARPTGVTQVLWIGTVVPTNATTSDLYFIEGTVYTPPAADTTAPTVPTNVTISNISSSGFTVSWTASTDAVGVTGYDVYLGGTLYGSTTTATTLAVTGRAASTTYQVTVRAKDAAGNASAQSAAVAAVTSSAAGTTQHTIFSGQTGTTPTSTRYNDGGTIRVANGFYTYSSTTGWRFRGVKLWIPAGAATPSTVDAFFWHPANGSAPDLLTPTQAKTAQPVVAGQWNTFMFDTPVVLTPGRAFWVGYQFSDGTYMASANPGGGFIRAADNAFFVLADNPFNNGSGTTQRSYYSINGGATAVASNANLYGLDAIVDEG